MESRTARLLLMQRQNMRSSSSRGLQQRDRYISYEAMAANNVPCGKHGNSYYNCNTRTRVNPYTRGCTEATGCYRYTH
ncbi:Protein RALF-like 4 [Linum grandiflorum]